MKTRITFAAILCVLFAMAMPVKAQVSITGNGSYLQTFDGLINTGTTPWLDNSTLANWWASRALGTNTLNTGGGGQTTGGLWSYGKNSSTDRAMGSLASGTTGSIAFGVQFQNNTTSTITNVLVAYTGEQWRKGGTLIPQADSEIGRAHV